MIVPMKKAHLLILKEDYEKVLKSLQRYEVLMPVNLSEGHYDDKEIQRTKESIKLLKKYREKKSIGDFNIVEYEEFIKDDPQREALLEKIERAQAGIDTLEDENEKLGEKLEFYRPWQELDIKLSELRNTRFVKIHHGFINPYLIDDVEVVVENYGSELIVLGSSKEGKAILYFNFYEDDNEVHQKIKNLGFIETNLPKDDNKVNLLILEIETKINANLEKIKKMQNNLKKYAKEIKQLEVLNDKLISESELKKVSGMETLQTLYLEGWVRNDQEDKLKKSLDEVCELYDLEIREPNEDEVPPTAYKNNKFVESFETITDMFGTPHHKEVDPNPAMAPWYWIIFGMMMGDVGYGIALILICALILNIFRPKGEMRKLMRVFLYSGITSIFWGVLFGSYFGATWKPLLLVPMDDPLGMLILSLALGAVHIISGILVKAYGNIRDNKLLDALFDQFSWVLILLGIGLIFLPLTSTIGTSLVIVGVGIIILTGGRKKKGIFGKITGGISGLFGVTNYLSDILSYSRILALSLSTAVIGMVMNMLAGMLQGSIIGIFFSIIVYIIGHVFNIAMGLLSAYVHDSRLQYIEFFGQFFEGGGYLFRPLSLKLEYVDEVTDKI